MKSRDGLGYAGLLVLIPALGLLTACNNILEWTVDGDSFDALLADGKRAIQAADYAKAEELFARAVEERPLNAEARYHYAKAVVLNGEVDVFDLVQTLTDADSPGGSAVEIFAFELDTANSIYQVNQIVVGALEPIREGIATEGEFAGADVDLDLAVAYTLRAILRLRDTNGDGLINPNDISVDDFNLVGDDGEYNLEGLENLDPEDINDMIGDLNEFLEDGGDLLIDIAEDSGIDVDELNNLIDSLGGDLSAYYVNTGVPGSAGEGDNDHDGLVDEECLNAIDDDLDGWIDEDSRIFSCP
jgi:hypothetical protein